LRELVGGGPGVEPVVELAGWDGPAYVEALGLVAAQPGELGVGDVVLDAFCDHAQVEAVGQGDGGGNQRCGAGVVRMTC
jgi:hypothetical protein